LRLAKFNVDTRQAENFIGLPTPANALLLGSFPLIIASDELGIGAVIKQPHVLAIFCVLMSALLVSEIPLFSLKFKQWSIKGNEFKIALIFLSLILFLLLKFAAVPFIIGVYILLSMIQTQLKK
jgi:CDP-diacylglycerol--serine O-phosphatidyltransferase